MLWPQLEAKGVKYQIMESSEFLLFDSIVGSEALNESLMAHLCTSIANNFDNEKETCMQSCEALSNVISSSLRRKTVLGTLEDAIQPIVGTTGVKADAGAKVLLESHRRMKSITDAEKHMKVLAESRGGTELLLREAILSDDKALSTCAISAVFTACETSGEFDFKRLASCPADVVASACVKSFPLFDRYISHLLFEAGNGGQGTSHSEGVECDTDERLRHLLLCGG